MVVYKKAREGYKWALTENGLEISRIRAKFEKTYHNRQAYEKQVPISWYDNGWVTEVRKENTDGV